MCLFYTLIHHPVLKIRSSSDFTFFMPNYTHCRFKCYKVYDQITVCAQGVHQRRSTMLPESCRSARQANENAMCKV